MTRTEERITRALTEHARQMCAGLEGPAGGSIIQRSRRRLLAEGRALGVSLPAPDEVSTWFTNVELELLMSFRGSQEHDKAIHAITQGHQMWKQGHLRISPALFHAWRFTSSLSAYEVNRERHPAPVTVAFDCDGVMYDFNGTLREWLVTRGWDRRHLPDPTVYSLADAWGLADHHLHEEIRLAVEASALWNIGHPLSDGVAAAHYLGTRGHTIIVNTARRIPGLESASRAATMTWLRAHGVHPDGLHLADPRKPADKLSVDFDVLLDDHAANVEVALAHGRRAYLIDRPWNSTNISCPRASFADAIRTIDRQSMPMPVA